MFSREKYAKSVEPNVATRRGGSYHDQRQTKPVQRKFLVNLRYQVDPTVRKIHAQIMHMGRTNRSDDHEQIDRWRGRGVSRSITDQVYEDTAHGFKARENTFVVARSARERRLGDPL